MTQTATVAFIGKSSNAPAELQGFINFRAGMEHRELKGDEPVAVMQIGSTDCYHVLPLDKGPTIAGIEEELSGIEAVLDAGARKKLESAIGRGRKGKK